MTNPGPTQEDFDSLIYKLATLESENRNYQKLLEAPPKRSLWRRLWGKEAKVVALLMVLVIGAGAAGATHQFMSGNDWLQYSTFSKRVYMDGFGSGATIWKTMTDLHPKETEAIWNCIQGWTPQQTIAVVEKYQKDNPHELDKPIFMLVWYAWRDACQKRGQPKR